MSELFDSIPRAREKTRAIPGEVSRPHPRDTVREIFAAGERSPCPRARRRERENQTATNVAAAPRSEEVPPPGTVATANQSSVNRRDGLSRTLLCVVISVQLASILFYIGGLLKPEAGQTIGLAGPSTGSQPPPIPIATPQGEPAALQRGDGPTVPKDGRGGNLSAEARQALTEAAQAIAGVREEIAKLRDETQVVLVRQAESREEASALAQHLRDMSQDVGKIDLMISNTEVADLKSGRTHSLIPDSLDAASALGSDVSVLDGRGSAPANAVQDDAPTKARAAAATKKQEERSKVR